MTVSFFGEGSPTTIKLKKRNGTLILTSLLEDLVPPPPLLSNYERLFLFPHRVHFHISYQQKGVVLVSPWLLHRVLVRAGNHETPCTHEQLLGDTKGRLGQPH